jgi:hypothetical protein
MKPIIVEATRIVDAPPAAAYNVFRDYNVGHQAVLPRPEFESMIVEKGGVGEGTVIYLTTRMFGQVRHMRQVVSEPEPGRILKEQDVDSTLFTHFIVDPLDDGRRSVVTIRTEFPAPGGLAGLFMRLMLPPMMRGLYKRELENLASYLRENTAAPVAQAAKS